MPLVEQALVNHLSPRQFQWLRVTRYIFYIVVIWILFVLSSLPWPLILLSFEWRFLISFLLFSNFFVLLVKFDNQSLINLKHSAISMKNIYNFHRHSVKKTFFNEINYWAGSWKHKKTNDASNSLVVMYGKLSIVRFFT